MLNILKEKAFYIAFVLTLICSLAGRFLAKLPGLKVIGAMVLALLLGMILQFIPGLKAAAGKGIGFISNKFLRLGIILLGFKLNIDTLIAAGVPTIILAIVVVTFTVVVLYAIARAAKIDHRLALLTAGGCGICGAAAVMGLSPQVDAEPDDSVLAVAIVAILGTVFTLISVILYPLLPLNDTQYAVMVGASLHEIAHVAAAAGVLVKDGLPSTAFEIALIMKLARVLLLAPAAIAIGLFYHKHCRHEAHADVTKKKLPMPWFMLGFIATSIIGTLLLKHDPTTWKPIIPEIEIPAFIILGMAMAALGFSVNFKVLLTRGRKILGIATLVSVLLYVGAFAAAYLFFGRI